MLQKWPLTNTGDYLNKKKNNKKKKNRQDIDFIIHLRKTNKSLEKKN